MRFSTTPTRTLVSNPLFCPLHGAHSGICRECRKAGLTKHKARRVGKLEHSIERLARLQTTTEMRVEADAMGRKIDAVILACRALLEEPS